MEQRRATQKYIRIAETLLRFALAAVFLYAGSMKARGPQRFAVDIESYRLLPPNWSLAAAYYLPYLELFCGLALLTRRTAPGGVAVAGGLMMLFTLALISAWARGLEIRCGCFGGNDDPTAHYPQWLVRDLALLAVCALLWRRLAVGGSAASKSRASSAQTFQAG